SKDNRPDSRYIRRVRVLPTTSRFPSTPSLAATMAGIEIIEQVQRASRAAKSYAFLQATFAQSAVSGSPIRDAIECIIPFIVPFLQKYPGRQLDLTALQEFLYANFSLSVPLYALQQVQPKLAKLGYLEHRKKPRFLLQKHRVKRTRRQTSFCQRAMKLALSSIESRKDSSRTL